MEDKITMIVAANSVLSYKKKNPIAEAEEVLKYVMSSVDAKGDAKILGIAAANYVLKYISTHPNATEKEVMQSLTNEINSILDSTREEY